MKTTWTCGALTFLLLSGCGRSPSETASTDSGTDTNTGTDPTATGGATGSTSPSGVSDSDSPTDSGIGDTKDVTGDTTTPTSTPGTGTDPDTDTATTSPVDPSDTSSSSSGDSQSSQDTSTGDDTSTGSDTGTTVADDTTTSDDTTTGDDTTEGPAQCGLELTVTIRDFMFSHPDFEDYCCGQVDGLVKDTLGGNNKPVFNMAGGLLSNADNFNQWYTDVPGVNQKTSIMIQLAEIQQGVFSYNSNSFFPIDNMLWGNEGQAHNYHFTTVPDTS